jgi:hypothetical protein
MAASGAGADRLDTTNGTPICWTDIPSTISAVKIGNYFIKKDTMLARGAYGSVYPVRNSFTSKPICEYIVKIAHPPFNGDYSDIDYVGLSDDVMNCNIAGVWCSPLYFGPRGPDAVIYDNYGIDAGTLQEEHKVTFTEDDVLRLVHNVSGCLRKAHSH